MNPTSSSLRLARRGHSLLRSTLALQHTRITGHQSSCHQGHQSSCHLSRVASLVRSYFTNGDRVKQDDPYAQLGLQYGDGASTQQIKAAFREKARELHPDVNTKDTPEQALQKFQRLQKAYETLMGHHNDADLEAVEEWRFSVWRSGDRIAQDRDDVAGVARKRPKPPASQGNVWAGRQLGHPSGRGTTTKRAEYLGDAPQPRSSSVGRGQNKWVKPKEYKPWSPDTSTASATKATPPSSK